MEKKSKGKPIKVVVFSTRNKAVILHSKMYGPEKTNGMLDKCFSNDMVVSKLLEAEKHGFRVLYSSKENTEGVSLYKEIERPELDSIKCEEKYWEKVKENLLKFYDEETTDAVIEHYHPLIIEDEVEVAYNLISEYVTDDSPNAKKLGIIIELEPNIVKEFSNIEKKVGNKIIKYAIKWEKIASVFIESHIQVFG
jgi:hypothetical protein